MFFTKVIVSLCNFSQLARQIKVGGQKLLEHQRDQYQKLFEYSADAFLIIDGDKFVDCNNATLKMLQYESKEALFATHPSELSPETQPDGRSSFEKANEMIAIAFEQGSNRFDWMHTRKNGECFPVEVLLTAITDNEKTLIHVVWRDMSKLSSLQHELVHAQRIAKIGSWVFDLRNNKLEWSNETFHIFEVDPDLFEVSYQAFLEAVHPEDRDMADNLYKESLKTNHHPYSNTYRLLFADGRIKYIYETGETMFNSAGEAIFSRGTTQDVTERVEAEKLLQESETKYRELVDSIPDILYRTDMQENITFISRSVYKLSGYTQEEATGMKMAEDVHANPAERKAFLAKLLENEFVDDFEARLRRKDGSIWWGSTNAHLLKAGDGSVLGVEGIIRDITERKNTEKQLNYQATYDVLTGLINRQEFELRAVRLLSTLTADSDEHALCFMDLDQFKVINDTCGHTAGDELLRQLGKVLQGAVSKRDTLARLGGDEFGVLMEHCTLDQAQRVASALLKRIQDFQFSWEGQSFRVGVSIGLVAVTKSTPNFTELLKQADAACYMAKDLGRNRIHTYLPEDTELAQRQGEMQWVTRINQALEENRLCLYAQPIVPLNGSNNKHYELLIRMVSESGEIIPPGAFLPAAERYGLMEKIDIWVIENVFNLLAENPGFVEKTHFIAINLSGQSLVDIDFLELITSQLRKSGVEARKICFEVTETVAISNLTAAISFISRLKKIGCRFALDDFGSGLSSFGYLKNLPVDFLKIDGMFVKDIVNDPIDYAMVRSINDIGQVMGMETIAEFVEDNEIKGMLKAIGVNYVQGYGIGKPKPFVELLETTNDASISR